MKMFVDLAAQRNGLLDQVTAVPRQQLETDREGIGWRFEQAEAVDGAALHGGQIGVVGLVAGVGGLPMLLGGQRVHDANLEARLGKGMLDGAVVASRPLDDHDLIPDPGLLQGATQAPDHGSEACLGVLNLGGWNENPAVEIGEHPLGPSLGTIDTNDTEVLRADPLDTWTDHATSLVNALGSGRGAFLGLGSASHGKDLLERVWGEDRLPRRKSAWL